MKKTGKLLDVKTFQDASIINFQNAENSKCLRTSFRKTYAIDLPSFAWKFHSELILTRHKYTFTTSCKIERYRGIGEIDLIVGTARMETGCFRAGIARDGLTKMGHARALTAEIITRTIRTRIIV